MRPRTLRCTGRKSISALPTSRKKTTNPPDGNQFLISCSSQCYHSAPRRGGRVAEGAPLLREYRVCSPIEGSNPSLSATTILFCIYFNNLPEFSVIGVPS